MSESKPEIQWEGKFLRVIKAGRWEYVIALGFGTSWQSRRSKAGYDLF